MKTAKRSCATASTESLVKRANAGTSLLVDSISRDSSHWETIPLDAKDVPTGFDWKLNSWLRHPAVNNVTENVETIQSKNHSVMSHVAVSNGLFKIAPSSTTCRLAAGDGVKFEAETPPQNEICSEYSCVRLTGSNDGSLIQEFNHNDEGESHSQNENIQEIASPTLYQQLCSNENHDVYAKLTDSAAHAFSEMTELQSSKESDDLRTGLVFEPGDKHYDTDNKFHRERPLRITSVYNYLLTSKSAILKRCRIFENFGRSTSSMDEIQEMVSMKCFAFWLQDDDYFQVHLPGYIQRLDEISKCNCVDHIGNEAKQYDSIYLTTDSIQAAKIAASSLCWLVKHVVSGNLDNGFAVIRPPGHHAEPGLASGYCVINNVAVAAAYAERKLGIKKILVVDWDVHHGNGTQRCFLDNPNVLYFSVHRYHRGNFFPFRKHGGPAEVGHGAGSGFNINVGWNGKNMGDDEYIAVWEKLLMPVANEFKPDLVLVSAGFDAARGDIGECDVTHDCFARLTRRLKTLANGKVVCALEGGYVRGVLCKCIESVLSSLLDSKSNERCQEELLVLHKKLGANEMVDCIDPSAAESIRETIKHHYRYWKCLKEKK